MSFLAQIFGSLTGFAAVELIAGASSGDRRLLRAHKVRCLIRAVDGRVADVGTEWSTGIAERARGHIRFEPGVVGERPIAVSSIRPTTGTPLEHVIAPWTESAEFVISTAQGDLYWVVNRWVARAAVARLAPADDAS